MAEVHEVIAAHYRAIYATLLKDLNGTPESALDWRLVPGAITIGSSLLHIIGYEYLVVSAIAGAEVASLLRGPEWAVYAPGFPRELNVPLPAGRDLGWYLSLIDRRRVDTIRFLDEMRDRVLDGETRFYTSGTLFKESSLTQVPNAELIMSLFSHASYHRGQITLIKHAYSLHKA
jgi:uncharacterized damage-inducible protein DinB